MLSKFKNLNLFILSVLLLIVGLFLRSRLSDLASADLLCWGFTFLLLLIWALFSKSELSDLASVSLNSGVLSVLLLIWAWDYRFIWLSSYIPGFPAFSLALLAIIIGIKSLIQIKKNKLEGKGLAITGIILGSFTIVLLKLLLDVINSYQWSFGFF